MEREALLIKSDHHLSKLTNVLSTLRLEESFVDTTLVCSDGQTVPAHRLVLVAASPLLRRLLLQQLPLGLQPIVMLSEVSARDLRAVLSYIYNGEVRVPHGQLASFMKAAEILQVEGLALGDDRSDGVGGVQSGAPQASVGKDVSQSKTSAQHLSGLETILSASCSNLKPDASEFVAPSHPKFSVTKHSRRFRGDRHARSLTVRKKESNTSHDFGNEGSSTSSHNASCVTLILDSNEDFSDDLSQTHAKLGTLPPVRENATHSLPMDCSFLDNAPASNSPGYNLPDKYDLITVQRNAHSGGSAGQTGPVSSTVISPYHDPRSSSNLLTGGDTSLADSQLESSNFAVTPTAESAALVTPHLQPCSSADPENLDGKLDLFSVRVKVEPTAGDVRRHEDSSSAHEMAMQNTRGYQRDGSCPTLMPSNITTHLQPDNGLSSSRGGEASSSADQYFFDPPSKRRKITTDSFFKNDLTLHEFLMSTNFGQVLISNYKQTNSLNDQERKKLVQVVMDGVTERHTYLNSARISEIADEIVQVFPTEVKEIYYTPPSLSNKNMGGKLSDRYRNSMKALKQLRVNARDEVTPKEQRERDRLIGEKVSMLETIQGPLATIKALWDETFIARNKTRLKCVSFNEFLQKWPVLQTTYGPGLVENDFEKLYPGKCHRLMEEWGKSSKKLHQILSSKPSFRKAHWDQYSSDDERNAAILSELPSMFTPHIIKGNGKTWKPSIVEAKEAFIKTVSDVAAMHGHAAAYREKCADLGLPLVPCIYRIVSSDVTEYVLHFDSVNWRFASILKCVDIAFKTYHVLNFRYPIVGTNLWTFIQKFFYEIVTKLDRSSPSVAILMKDLGNK